MRRNARSSQHADDYLVSSVPFQNARVNDSALTESCLKMNVISSDETAKYSSTHRFENTIEAKVEIGDTLQAIALRFHCTVADIRRLNKIDKDNEIHARKVVKIPVTVHNVLLDNLPIVHESGNNSPRREQKSEGNNSRDSNSGLSSIIRNPLEDAEAVLSEKLMVASVNLSSVAKPLIRRTPLTKGDATSDAVLNSKIKPDAGYIYSDEDISTYDEDISAPLITDILDDSTDVPHLHRIRGPSFHAMDWSGSDCDMSWICLFVVILALCFVIPLVYVFYIAEHSHHNATGTIPTSQH